MQNKKTQKKRIIAALAAAVAAGAIMPCSSVAAEQAGVKLFEGASLRAGHGGTDRAAAESAAKTIAGMSAAVLHRADAMISHHIGSYGLFKHAARLAYQGEAGIDLMTTGALANSFFGTVAVPFSNIGAKSSWNSVRTSGIGSAETCDSAACRKRYDRLAKASAKGQSFADTLRNINRAVNAEIRYESDRDNYQTLDHWAPGSQTIARGKGDCEDFAILKHALLVKAGIPANSLSLVVLKDNARGIYHAVLAVSTNKGHFILDNLRNDVYRDTSASQYQPLYSFSAGRSWIHGRPASGEETVASKAALGDVAPGEGISEVVATASLPVWIADDLRPTQRF